MDSTKRHEVYKIQLAIERIYLPMIERSEPEIAAGGTYDYGKGVVSCCGTTCSDMQAVGAHWYYYYWPTPENVPCAGMVPVSMFRDPSHNKYLTYTMNSGINLVMLYNEMNVGEPAGAQMSLDQAIENWHWMEVNLPLTVTVVGPSLYEYSQQPYGWTELLNGYIASYGHLPRMDYAAAHWYKTRTGSTSNFGESMDKLHDTFLSYGYPADLKIWVSELGIGYNAGGKTASILTEILQQIRARPYISNYAYFAPRLDGFGTMSASALISKTGRLTEAGKVYRDW